MNIFQKIDAMKLSGLILFILIAMLITCSGCIGGRSVDARSTGAVITSSNLVRQPNGIYKLVPKSKPVKIGPFKSRPESLSGGSAKANPIPKVNVAPSNPPAPKKDPPKIIIPQLPTITNQTGELPIIIDNDGNEYNLVPNKESPEIKVNWMELIKFYLIALIFIAVVYWGFKGAKKKTESMIAKKTSKKKAPKKRVAKKRK
jgi:hypothetical protein